MKERILLFIIIAGLTAFLYIFQNHVNTMWGFLVMMIMVVLFAIYMNLTAYHNKRKLAKNPKPINENYKPFISVMIPSHNEEYVIENTVDNIMQMDYPHFEVILIDDRSTDNTPQLLEKIKQKYDGKIKTLIRSKDAFPGKSAVLNDAMELAEGEAILVFDADATVKPDFLSKMVPCLEPEDVAAVQARKIIRNCDDNLLTRCQYNEYVLDTYMQYGRDAIKSAVELRGNGELIKRKALEDIGFWNIYTITDDLDMSTRLQIKGWDIRYCIEAEVYEEGIRYLKPLFRQRRRWMEGTIRRYLEYLIDAFKSKKMSLRAKMDMIIYIIEFIGPAWVMLEFGIRLFRALSGRSLMHNEIISAFIVAALMGITGFILIRYSLRRYANQSCINAFIQAIYTTFYFFMLWVPVVMFIGVKILFRKKDMEWGKTAHGLVLEEEAELQKKEELQEV